MDIHFDGLTSYCVEGAWRMSNLSPLTYSLAMHTPFGYHKVDYDGVSDDSVEYSMMDTNRIMRNVLADSAIEVKRYVASYAHWHILEWMMFISQRISSELVNRSARDDYTCNLSRHFESFQCAELIPRVEDCNQLLSPIVIENAVTAYMQSYIGEWWDESLSFLSQYHDADYDCLPVEEQFAECGYQLTRINHPDTFRRINEPMQLHKPDERKRIKTAKKAIARGRKLFDMLINGKKTVDAFISGDEVDIQGSIFNYTIRKTYGLLDQRTTFKSIPYKLAVFDKDNGLELARLCVYFDNTPILDQVYGFILYINAGIEYEKRLLKTANVFLPTEAGKKSEKLKKYTSFVELTPKYTENDGYGMGTIDFEEQTIGKTDVKAVISVFIFHKLMESSGLSYPLDCLNGVIRELVDKSSLESAHIDYLTQPTNLLTNFRGNYE